MRSYLLLMIFLLTGTVAFAQQDNRGAITVISRQPIMMAIDNRLYDLSGTELTIGNVPRGTHNLKIFQARNRRGRIVKGFLLFETRLQVAAGGHTVAQFNDRRGSLRVRQEPLDRSAANSVPDQPQNYQDDVYDPAPQRSESEQPDASDEIIPAYQLTDQQLRDLETQVKALSSDTKKKEQLQSVLQMKTYTVAQLQQMAGWLNFESERLDFLKWAYTNTDDKASYQQLNTLFRYESSKKELSDYIAQQQ